MEDREDRKKGGRLLGSILIGVGLLLMSLLTGRRGSRTVGEDQSAQEARFGRLVVQGWIIVCGLAVVLMLYGLFALSVVGDKGPPGWDFGSVPDVPGQSTFSTYPYRGRMQQPPVQHVDERPSRAIVDTAGTVQGKGPVKRPE